MLIDAIRAAGGPSYAYTQIDPVNDADGGQPGGNIRVGFLFNPAREIALAPAPAGDSTTAESVVVRDRKPHLALNPGRIAPTEAAWTASRKPLAAEFTYRGKTIFVIANHFVSKGGDQPLYGRFQPPGQASRTQRGQQAQVEHDFVAQILAVNPKANVVIAGDLNDFDGSPPVTTLAGTSLLDLPATLPLNQRYTYVFEGNSQVLDHILISPVLQDGYGYTVVHVNSEFADQASDHEPQVASLTPR
jgi:predicted extracellular nuclease